jgi:DNA-binding winged helix-turn-helix (wHTH) protein
VPKEDFLLGDWLVQPSLNLVSRDAVSTRLEPKVMQVLICLADHAGQVIGKEQLIATVWPDTFVADQVLTHAIWQLRQVFGDDPKHPLFIETIPKSGYRLTATVRTTVAQGGQETITAPVLQKKRPWVKYALASAVLLIVAAAITSYFYLHRRSVLTEKDTILLADFNNTTGDPVFDGTLRQGLAVQLEQSPFLSLVSEQQVQQTLRLMGRPADAKLTPEISREICLRTGSKAAIDGSIAQMGTQYSLILKAVNCSNGESLASTEAQASDKSHLLDALGKAASEIRKKLGESIRSVQKLDTPLEQATTPSLEALQFYSLGGKAYREPIPCPQFLCSRRPSNSTRISL